MASQSLWGSRCWAFCWEQGRLSRTRRRCSRLRAQRKVFLGSFNLRARIWSFASGHAETAPTWPGIWCGNTGVLEPVSLEGTSTPLALQDRAANRAYDGAPPTIPHAVQQSAAAECMACHEAGMTLRGHRASPIPHEAMGNCLQCHVVQDGPQPGERLLPDAPTAAVNSFAGLTSPEAGERAWSIAPPVVPHSTQLRERCLSCHGPGGRDAMRSTHPDRQSCTQCHALQAESEQRPLSWSAEP